MVYFLHIGRLFQKHPHTSNYLTSSLLQYMVKKNIRFLKTLHFCLVVQLVEYLLTKQFSILKTQALHTDESFQECSYSKEIFH